jgi:GT2 family glycosyltransferase
MSKRSDYSAIVISYNSEDVIESCLAKLCASERPPTNVVVVDNNSRDRTVDFVRRGFPHIALITNQINKGFAAANNQALTLCTGRYIFCLNPDTEVLADATAHAVQYMEARPDIGIAGCRILNADGSPQDSVSFRYPGQKYAGMTLDHLPGKIASVLGAALIIRSALLRELAGFDEEFFLYGEDQDLCLRVRKAGYSVGFIPESVVMHIGGHSEQSSPFSDVWRKKMNAEMIFQRKHYSADTAKRIRTANLAKCQWRLLMLSLAKAFGCCPDDTKAKIAKYRVIRDALRAPS